ncbi:MAG: hypothetical protein WCC36_17380 [Gammaproteobacteria bacterium]
MAWQYASPCFDREYQFDKPSLARLLKTGGRDLAATVGRLRLVNTRNRLTHCLLGALAVLQQDYLLSGDPLRLHPLTQVALAAHLRSTANCTVIADPSRLSRLIRGLAVRIPAGPIVPLRTLCPRERDLYRLYVSDVITEERANMIARDDFSPLSDTAIGAVLSERFGARLLPRTVAYIRRDLGIPSFRNPARKARYVTATLKFSPVLPFSAEAVMREVPSQSGVYEIRVAYCDSCTCPVIYLGSARDLRKRLLDHLRGYSNNPTLHRYIRGGTYLRYCPVPDGDWRTAEREAYQAFCESFGAPPSCNRMSP